MSKQTSVENQKDGKRGKITSFLIPRNEQESVSLFKARSSLHTFPSAVRSAFRSHNDKLVGLFEIISSRGGFQARDNSYRFRNTTFYKNEGRYSRVYILFFVVVKSKHTTPRNGSHVESRA